MNHKYNIILSPMKALRWLGLPLALVYGAITALRNLFFDWGLLKTLPLPAKSIGVGNLSVGGTGKSVVVNFLIAQCKIKGTTAVLSRGYGRQTKGYVLADHQATAQSIGDEPFQFKQRHPEVLVAVAEKRVIGIQQLQQLSSPPEYILLDDVFQHRWVSPAKMILCTRYDALFSEDYLLPVGRLRELRSGKKRAHLCLVTNCPAEVNPTERQQIAQKLRLSSHQKLVFSRVCYTESLYGSAVISPDELYHSPLLVVTGIAHPERFFEFLKKKNFRFQQLVFPDHHSFSAQELQTIQQMAAGGNILTTEKDYGRLQPQLKSDRLYYWPIELEFLSPEDQQNFEEAIWEE